MDVPALTYTADVNCLILAGVFGVVYAFMYAVGEIRSFYSNNSADSHDAENREPIDDQNADDASNDADDTSNDADDSSLDEDDSIINEDVDTNTAVSTRDGDEIAEYIAGIRVTRIYMRIDAVRLASYRNDKRKHTPVHIRQILQIASELLCSLRHNDTAVSVMTEVALIGSDIDTNNVDMFSRHREYTKWWDDVSVLVTIPETHGDVEGILQEFINVVGGGGHPGVGTTYM